MFNMYYDILACLFNSDKSSVAVSQFNCKKMNMLAVVSLNKPDLSIARME